MVRTGQKKARTGCQRCKLRKVKCDEARPECSACVRHQARCEYADILPRRRAPVQQQTGPVSEAVGTLDPPLDEFALDHSVELRLMHEWTAHTSVSFAPAPESTYWRDKAPLIAIERRPLKNAMFSLSAQRAAQSMTGKTRECLGNTALLCYDRAVHELYRDLPEGMVDDAESVYLTAVVLSVIALSNLAETADLSHWLRVCATVRTARAGVVAARRTDSVQSEDMAYGRAHAPASKELWDREHGKPFSHLMTFASEYESITAEDEEAYTELLGLLALLLKDINAGTQSPLRICSRLVALPSNVPSRLVDLVEAKNPRALVMLAHYFAIVKLIQKDVHWLRGVADKHINLIHDQIPTGWRGAMGWPMLVVEGNTTKAACSLIMMLVT